MFLEIHTVVVDNQKRYLDLTQLSNTFPGWKSFGEWVDKGDHIECTAGWMSCFSGYYNNTFNKHNLKYMKRNGIVKKFEPSENNVVDPTSALIYGLLVAKNNSEKSGDILNQLGE